MPCRFCFVCSGQTMVWWQQTMVWCEHTIVCRQQTINEARLRPTEAECSNGLFNALQTKPATRRRVNQKEEITRENESFTAGCFKKHSPRRPLATMRRKTSEWPPTDRQIRSRGQANRPNDSTFEHKKSRSNACAALLQSFGSVYRIIESLLFVMIVLQSHHLPRRCALLADSWAIRAYA